MRSLAITQANLDNQRNAVQEERRLGVDNQPYGKTFDTISETAFDNFANKHSTIGSMEDLNAASVKDVQDFFRIYYAPNNAVLTLVGDFKKEDALTRIKKYFGSIPSQPAPPAPDLTEQPQHGERRKTIEDAFAQTPRLDIVYRIPPGNTSGWYSSYVLASLLGGGQSSRLYQALVKDKELAVNVAAMAQEHRGPSLFDIIVLARPGKDRQDIEKAVYAEIDKLQAEPAADWELEKVRAASRFQAAQQMQRTLFRAILIGQMTVYYNDPDLVNTRFARIQSVGKEDIQLAAKTYLVEENRTVIATLPKPKAMAAEVSK